jgi:heme A synthase
MAKRYTASELDARLKFAVGLTLAAVLFTTTIAILYALVFVTQPIGEQAENDKMFFSVLSSIATFITGTLAGLMIGQNKAAVDPDPQPTTDELVVEEGQEQQ